jgi:E3 ubiquitin-protein ligase RBBP6
MVLADSLIPNHTVRSTISNMLSTRAGGSTTNGMTKHRSSSGSNPVPKLQSQVPPAASEREEIKPPMDHHVSEAAAPDGGLQVATKDDLVNQPLEKLAANVDPQSKDEVSSAELPVEKAGTSANLKLQDGGESILKITTVSGTLEQNATKTDQPKKRKKAGSTKIVQPNNADFGYDIPIDPTYYNPFVGGYPWVTEPYMYGSMGMPYGCYPMGPYGISPMNIMPPQAPPTHGYPPNYHRFVS